MTTQLTSKFIQVNKLTINIGYEEINWYYPKDTTGMYYNLFTAMGHNIINESSAGVPLLIWLQGGPGASSQFGAFT